MTTTRRLFLALALFLGACDMAPMPASTQIGDACTCDAGAGMVVTEVAYGDDGSTAVYCAAEVGNPALAQCVVQQ